ncbi:Protein of unknown function [Pyronema omphalodes CBS 100304]|uniref:Uncharacterized protein n=1 Tax=Pyronema omphalodes (strain CBS 100304) TaxID=1076935 RepID=U4LKF8_PYROM|nr:Protein of unknown function [Pyronema omphalodes CBS 100304]
MKRQDLKVLQEEIQMARVDVSGVHHVKTGSPLRILRRLTQGTRFSVVSRHRFLFRGCIGRTRARPFDTFKDERRKAESRN